jgi:hypothetical protein
MLRCVLGTVDISTQIVDGLDLVAAIGATRLARCLVRPRRPVAGELHLLPLLQENVAGKAAPLLRWDSLYLVPINDYARSVFSQVKDWLCLAPVMRHALLMPGDTLLVDNWRVLHGRSAADDSAISREIHRVYLSSLK